MNKNVGLLLPRSVIYPSMAFDIIGGLKSGLEDAGINDVSVTTESIGIGGDDKQIIGACEKLLIDGIKIVAGYVNPGTAEKLAPVFAAANAIFIALDAGYHFPTAPGKLSNVFTLSLDGALCIRTVASTAVNDGCKQVAFTSSFYDSGYRSAYAFYHGLEDSGGAITYNMITSLKRADFSLQPLITHLEGAPDDGVFTAFCGDMLQDLFTVASANNVFKDHPVYGSSFAGDEQWLAQSLYPGTDIKVCVPWASTLDNEANVHFKEILTKKNININIFSLLGWDAASVMAKAIVRPTAEAITMLEGFTFSSPRGIVKLNVATHKSNAPVYDAIVMSDDAKGNCKIHVVRQSPYTEEQREKLEQDISNIAGSMSSWHNAYGCLDS